ncbi:flagellar biosynthesis protein FlgN [Treponema sp. HNW]|uniref:flagellar biosynthesis protein FlgN n=1 Tax=Treponema sp. HNW TaxID=3116654 RepID=UPI003D0C4E4A
MQTQAIDDKELNERVAILHRLRELLLQQRRKFQEYLTVLEKQETTIDGEDMDKLLAHTELEQKIIGNISELQKVIKPMEDLYKAAYPDNQTEIPVLQADLSQLQTRILLQNEKNRSALRLHINSVRSKINALKNPYAKTRSVYAHSAQTAAAINIQV